MAVAAGLPESGLEVRILGSGSGLPPPGRDTTSLLVSAAAGRFLVDCPGSIVTRLTALGLDVDDLDGVLLTHDHVDHLYGLPHLVHALAIARARTPLSVWAPGPTLDRVRRLVAVHELDREGYPPLDTAPVDLRQGAPVLGVGGLRVTACRADHPRDTAALRFEADGAVAVHSSDTRPSEEIAALAADADLLLHDCGGPERLRDTFGAAHSTALEAGRIAAAAGARRLVLVHLGREAEGALPEVLEEARGSFGGPVAAAADGDVHRLEGRRG